MKAPSWERGQPSPASQEPRTEVRSLWAWAASLKGKSVSNNHKFNPGRRGRIRDLRVSTQLWEIPDITHADFEDCQKHGVDVGRLLKLLGWQACPPRDTRSMI